MTKEDLIAAVMAEVGDRTTDADTLAIYRVWFDDGLETILSRTHWPRRRGLGTIDVVAVGFETFTIPEEVSEIRTLRDLDTRAEIVHIDRARLLESGIDLTETGRPAHWYYAGVDDDNAQLAGLHPLPSEDMTLQYDAHLSLPLPLDDDATIPLTRELIGVLREIIRAYSYENEAQTELAGAAWQRAFGRLAVIKQEQGNDRAEARPKLREDGDLANARRWYPRSRFAPIVSSS